MGNCPLNCYMNQMSKVVGRNDHIIITQYLFLYQFLSSASEYQQLLKFWLTSGLPLFVTNKSTTLPLTYRPLHTYTAHPLHLWFVLQSGERWIRFNLQGMDTMTREDRMKAFNDELFSFVDRLQYPIVVSSSCVINFICTDCEATFAFCIHTIMCMYVQSTWRSNIICSPYIYIKGIFNT